MSQSAPLSPVTPPGPDDMVVTGTVEGLPIMKRVRQVWADMTDDEQCEVLSRSLARSLNCTSATVVNNSEARGESSNSEVQACGTSSERVEDNAKVGTIRG